MRRARTLVAGSALGFAALTLAIPAAYADAPAPVKPDAGQHSSGGAPEKPWAGDGKWTPDKANEHSSEDKGESSSHEKSGKEHKDHKSPHGGVHTGIGGAFLDDGAALGTGAALIAGGVGVGIYALRRRPGATAAQA
ncbi:hypothetical protein [Embleya sp. AB8]|uniref:hypothetical protein n=1 Tax=Embleya sp. AB8 TaxID=3156304 RepID=UPI003C77DBF6